RREGGDAEREVGEPSRRDVQVHEPLRVALHGVGRRDPQPEHREHRQRDERRPPDDGDEPPVQQRLVHASSRSGPKASIPIDVYNVANSASSATHGHPSEVALPSPASQARVAPSITGATTGSSSSGTSVSRTRNPAATTPERVPVAATPAV